MENTIRVLVLDDDGFRHEVYDKWYSGHDTVAFVDHAYNLVDFQMFLASGKYNVIALDHDLGDYGELPWKVFGQTSVGERNGKHAARLVAELPVDFKPGQVIVHTNGSEGNKMVDILNEAGIIAFWAPFSPNRGK